MTNENNRPGMMNKAFHHERLPKRLLTPAKPPAALVNRKTRNTTVPRPFLMLPSVFIINAKAAKFTTPAHKLAHAAKM